MSNLTLHPQSVLDELRANLEPWISRVTARVNGGVTDQALDDEGYPSVTHDEKIAP